MSVPYPIVTPFTEIGTGWPKDLNISNGSIDIGNEDGDRTIVVANAPPEYGSSGFIEASGVTKYLSRSVSSNGGISLASSNANYLYTRYSFPSANKFYIYSLGYKFASSTSGSRYWMRYGKKVTGVDYSTDLMYYVECTVSGNTVSCLPYEMETFYMDGKGSTQYSNVTSTSSSTYPSNGVKGSYWYVKIS